MTQLYEEAWRFILNGTHTHTHTHIHCHTVCTDSSTSTIIGFTMFLYDLVNLMKLRRIKQNRKKFRVCRDKLDANSMSRDIECEKIFSIGSLNETTQQELESLIRRFYSCIEEVESSILAYDSSIEACNISLRAYDSSRLVLSCVRLKIFVLLSFFNASRTDLEDINDMLDSDKQLLVILISLFYMRSNRSSKLCLVQPSSPGTGTQRTPGATLAPALLCC